MAVKTAKAIMKKTWMPLIWGVIMFLRMRAAMTPVRFVVDTR